MKAYAAGGLLVGPPFKEEAEDRQTFLMWDGAPEGSHGLSYGILLMVKINSWLGPGNWKLSKWRKPSKIWEGNEPEGALYHFNS